MCDCSEPVKCSEKETLAVIKNDVRWIKDALADTKNVGVYKKMTWFNFAGLAGICWMTIKSFIMSS